MISVYDRFKIGMGPLSSHVTGLMKAAGRGFRQMLTKHPLALSVARVEVTLSGSLA